MSQVVAGGPDDETMVEPTPASSGWEINRVGLASVLLVVLAVVLLWGRLDGGADDSGDADGRSTNTTKPPVSRSTVASTTTTTAPRPTTVPATEVPTTTVASERRVLIRGEMKPCQFGDRCLVASFVIEGFDDHPGRFVCIYPNSHSDFGFNDDDVDDACLTGDAGDTITIEVDGVRSATISEDDLDGAG